MFCRNTKELADSVTKYQQRRNDLGYELERRRAIRDLQIREYEHPFLWWPKFLLMLFVCLYWAARFLVKLTGLDDFNVAIAELSQTEAVVSSLVLGYMFLGNKIERMVRMFQ